MVKKKYKVIALNSYDARKGIHTCNVNGMQYDIPINKEVELPDAVIAYLKDARDIRHIPVDDKAHEDGIDIATEGFPTEVTERFQIAEIAE